MLRDPILSELIALICVAPAMRADLRRQLCDGLGATDSSLTHGGSVICNPPTKVLEDLYTLCEERGGYVRLDWGSGPPPSTMQDNRSAVASLVKSFAWSEATCHGWKTPQHVNVLELEEILVYLKWQARRGRRNLRLIVVVDSRVALGAAAKGRSSGKPLDFVCRRIAAACLRYGYTVDFVWAPSAFNPADAPSRMMPLSVWYAQCPDLLPVTVSSSQACPGDGWVLGQMESGPGLRVPGLPSGGPPPGLSPCLSDSFTVPVVWGECVNWEPEMAESSNANPAVLWQTGKSRGSVPAVLHQKYVVSFLHPCSQIAAAIADEISATSLHVSPAWDAQHDIGRQATLKRWEYALRIGFASAVICDPELRSIASHCRSEREAFAERRRISIAKIVAAANKSLTSVLLIQPSGSSLLSHPRLISATRGYSITTLDLCHPLIGAPWRRPTTIVCSGDWLAALGKLSCPGTCVHKEFPSGRYLRGYPAVLCRLIASAFAQQFSSAAPLPRWSRFAWERVVAEISPYSHRI